MTSREVRAVMDNYYERYKNGWEQTRYIAFIIAATNSDKIKKPTDLIKFTWDKKDTPKEKLSNEEIQRRAEEMMKRLQNITPK